MQLLVPLLVLAHLSGYFLSLLQTRSCTRCIGTCVLKDYELTLYSLMLLARSWIQRGGRIWGIWTGVWRRIWWWNWSKYTDVGVFFIAFNCFCLWVGLFLWMTNEICNYFSLPTNRKSKRELKVLSRSTILIWWSQRTWKLEMLM